MIIYLNLYKYYTLTFEAELNLTLFKFNQILSLQRTYLLFE